MAIENAQADDEARIRARLEERAKATRAKDVPGIMACYAPQTRSFDCHSRLQLAGAAALRQHLEACMPCMRGPMGFEMHDLQVAAQGDVAFGHYLARYRATGQGGEEHAGWLRVTVGLRKVAGEWLIVHDHCSVPFDACSGQALLDLAPERAERASAARGRSRGAEPVTAALEQEGHRMLVGKCLCGAVRYAVEGPFRYAGYCHCARYRLGVQRLRQDRARQASRDRGRGQHRDLQA